METVTASFIMIKKHGVRQKLNHSTLISLPVKVTYSMTSKGDKPPIGSAGSLFLLRTIRLDFALDRESRLLQRSAQ